MITTALQYSGGKDSRAVLHMYRDQLKDIIVVWLDAGAPYPEQRAHMAQIARAVPHFLIVKGDQPGQIERNGYPSDVVPMNYSPLGRQFLTGNDFKVQSTFGCCNENIWQPLQKAMVQLGITKIIRGQRDSDDYRNNWFKHGAKLGQFECVSPLESWSEKQVFDYLLENKVEIPEYYKTEMTGRDCWNCTGYLRHNGARIRNLPQQQRAEVIRRLGVIKRAVDSETATAEILLENSQTWHTTSNS